MIMRINFWKILENVISYLVTGVFIGACAIVWRGATTVDERVNKTEESIKVLINNLSSKLSNYEIQLDAQSNQLAAVYTELKNIKPLVSPIGNLAGSRTNRSARQPLASNERNYLQHSIQQELLKK